MKLSEAKINFLENLSRGALLTATDMEEKSNTMTVSWGGCGILWGKQVCFLFVRPERHTYKLLENGKYLSLSFFNEDKKDVLTYCGTKSGRDVDKFKECDLEYTLENGSAIFKGSACTIHLKTLYKQDLNKECFLETESLKWYQNQGMHKMYICEILEVKEQKNERRNVDN